MISGLVLLTIFLPFIVLGILKVRSIYIKNFTKILCPKCGILCNYSHTERGVHIDSGGPYNWYIFKCSAHGVFRAY